MTILWPYNFECLVLPMTQSRHWSRFRRAHGTFLTWCGHSTKCYVFMHGMALTWSRHGCAISFSWSDKTCSTKHSFQINSVTNPNWLWKARPFCKVSNAAHKSNSIQQDYFLWKMTRKSPPLAPLPFQCQDLSRTVYVFSNAGRMVSWSALQGVWSSHTHQYDPERKFG